MALAETGGQRLTLRLVGVAGALLFGTFFALTYSVPGWVEQYAAEFIEAEARKRVDNTIDAINPSDSDSALLKLAQSVYAHNEAQIESLKTQLRDRVYEVWAREIAKVRELDCACRKHWENYLADNLQISIRFVEWGNEQVGEFIHASYMDVATKLKADIRIFTATNATAFLLVLLLSFLKPTAVVHLFAPGFLLALSTLICSYFYVFQQNWLLTIIYQSYLGFAYLGWLGFVFLFLCDIVFLKGHVTSAILNGIFSALGSAFSVGPC